MKRKIIILLFIGNFSAANAQQIQNGGFGYFMIGPTFLSAREVDEYLEQPDVLGPSYNAPVVALQGGGEGFAIINRFLIGGGGFCASQFSQQTDSGLISQSGGGGYFKTGYVVWATENMFMNAAIGFGGFAYNYLIKNNQSESGIYFNKEFPIGLGEESNYTFAGTCFDVSYGIKIVTGAKREENGETRIGGFVFGADAGCLLNITSAAWTGDEGTVIGPPSPGFTAMPYIRMTIGGGGFRLNSPPNR